jgi:hypothetical protein
MRNSPPADAFSRLLPEGRRWGFGAHSLLPYLTIALQSRPGDGQAPSAVVRNPVFPHMENLLSVLRNTKQASFLKEI